MNTETLDHVVLLLNKLNGLHRVDTDLLVDTTKPNITVLSDILSLVNDLGVSSIDGHSEFFDDYLEMSARLLGCEDSLSLGLFFKYTKYRLIDYIIFNPRIYEWRKL